MALAKPINSVINGVDISYWKISSISLSYTSNLAQIYVMGFVNKDIRNSGLENSVVLNNYFCKKDKFNNYFGTEQALLNGNYANTLQASYDFLKENIQDFKDAIDC